MENASKDTEPKNVPETETVVTPVEQPKLEAPSKPMGEPNIDPNMMATVTVVPIPEKKRGRKSKAELEKIAKEEEESKNKERIKENLVRLWDVIDCKQDVVNGYDREINELKEKRDNIQDEIDDLQDILNSLREGFERL